MVLAMNCNDYRGQVEQAISGAEGLPNNLPLSSLRAFLFVIPPVNEQHAIVEAAAAMTSNVTIAIDRANRKVTLLREYRTRLIADVVTGKLDVRAAARGLPDASQEPEALEDSALLDEADEDAADQDLDATAEEAEA